MDDFADPLYVKQQANPDENLSFAGSGYIMTLCLRVFAVSQPNPRRCYAYFRRFSIYPVYFFRLVPFDADIPYS